MEIILSNELASGLGTEYMVFVADKSQTNSSRERLCRLDDRKESMDCTWVRSIQSSCSLLGVLVTTSMGLLGMG